MEQVQVDFEMPIISRGRVTIPDDIRERLNLKEGQRIRFKGTLEIIESVKEAETG